MAKAGVGCEGKTTRAGLLEAHPSLTTPRDLMEPGHAMGWRTAYHSSLSLRSVGHAPAETARGTEAPDANLQHRIGLDPKMHGEVRCTRTPSRPVLSSSCRWDVVVSLRRSLSQMREKGVRVCTEPMEN